MRMLEKINIRQAKEEDRSAIAFVYADVFSEYWNQLSTDTMKVIRALMNGIILEKYIVATWNEKVFGFLDLEDSMNIFLLIRF